MVHDAADRFTVVFDDERVVANAGVMLPALLAGRLGIEALVDGRVDLGNRPGAANPGRKVMTMVSAMVLGADCIEDCDVLRSGQTAVVLGHRVSAPSTIGTFLRTFTFGHVRQLDKLQSERTAPASYVVVSPSQANYLELYGLADPPALRALTNALETSPRYREVYRRGAARVFEWSR